MGMQLETRNRKAFELVTDALREIDHYKRSRSHADLQRADAALERARSLDPQYLRAVYYSAMVSDLIGKPQQAIEDFSKVLDENPPFVDEVHYNLAVSYYHRYDWKNLEKAVEHFQNVIETTRFPTLRVLARAGLTQTYAMRMIPKDPRSPDLQEIQREFMSCDQEYRLTMEEVSRLKDIDRETKGEALWTTHNARGMALMYHSDFFRTEEEKISQLKEAIEELEKADQYSPKNWANYCDLASAHMRLGYLLGSPEKLIKAVAYLEEVVQSLRPNYGFALYEIARCYRLMGRFSEALDYLARSQAIPYEERNVSDRRINLERERTEHGSKEYP